MESIIRRAASAIAVMICLAICDTIARADVKIKAKSTQGSSRFRTDYVYKRSRASARRWRTE